MTKKIALFLLISATLFSQLSYAQYCGNSGTAICAPGTGLSYLDGFKPPYDSLPCAQKGVYFDEVIRFAVPPTVTSGNTTYNLNWLEIKTIGNLPCGLCWSTNKAAVGNVPANRFNKNEQACIRVTGTTYDNVGQFKLSILVDVNVTAFGFPVTQTNQDASQAGLKYYLRVQNVGGACPNVDTLAAGNTAISVGPDIAASMSAGGATTFCQGGSVVLTAAPSASTSYQWFNGLNAIQGATAPTYTANASGNYNVKVVKGCKGSTSSNTTVTVNPLPTASISPAGPVQLCNNSTQQLTASPAGASYIWLNNGSPIGQTTQSITVSTGGSYSVSVTSSNCSSVSAPVSVSTGGSNISVVPKASSLTICSGQAVTLNAGSGYTSYSWTGGGSDSTKVVSTSGTYQVTVTLTSGGCTSTGIGSIQITDGVLVPAITTLPATTSGCQGTVAVLDAGAGYDTYSWTGGSSSQSITPTSSGPYSVTVTKVGFCGNATASTNLTIFQLPVINLAVTPNPATTCPGVPITVDAGSGFDTYVWSNSSNTQTIQGEMDSTYSVTVTKTENNCTSSDSFTVNVLFAGPPDTPNVNQNYTFCLGDSAFVDAGFGYDSYVWSNNFQGQYFWVKDAGSYSVTVTKAGKCGSTVASFNVVTNALPDATFTNNGGVLTANASGVTYQWFKNNAQIGGANTSTYTPTETGDYSLEVNDGTCKKRSSALSISVGINEIGKAIKLSAVPNPSYGLMSVRFTLQQETEIAVQVMDMAGRVLLETNNMFSAGENQQPIDLSNYTSGLYLLSLQTKEGKASLIIVRE